MQYWHYLLGISLLFILLEKFFPRREKQKLFRKGFFTDLLFVVFNGHYLSIVLEAVQIYVLVLLNNYIQLSNFFDIFRLSFLSSQSFFVQFIILFFVIDFIQWLIHVMLHKIPFLWQFHKIHHSIEEMDWMGNMRFHWFEIIVYKSVLFFPLAFFGFSSNALFWFAVFSTFMGHFNHSNVKASIGSLKYLFNSPVMHIWHHDLLRKGQQTHNFGINLSLWDWIFKTAYMPINKVPGKLGLEDIETIPKNFFGKEIYPLLRRK